MAIIRPGPLAGAISGKLGGLVFVAGQGTPFVRPRPAPRNKDLKFLGPVRSYMGRLVNAWRAFDDEAKATWRTAAILVITTNRLGTSKPMTGFQYFIHANMISIPSRNAIFTIPPPPAFINPPQSSSIAFSAAGNYVVNAVKPVGIPVAIYHIFGWPFWTNQRPGDIPRPVFLKSISTPSPLAQNIRPEWEDHFGSLQEGQFFFCRLKVRSNVNPVSFVIDFLETVAA